MKTKKKLAVIAILLLGITLFSCSSELEEVTSNKKISSEVISIDRSAIEPCGTPMMADFFAGQHINVGTIIVENDATNLYVTYSLTGNWSLEETHLYVGECDSIPYNNAGNPIIGHFPYSSSHSGIQEFTYSIPLSELGECFCVVAHASVTNGTSSETAFGFGTPFSGPRWGWYFEYCVQECPPTGCEDCPPAGCETAFAFGSQCFISDSNYNFNRWGWVNGPIDVADMNSIGDIPIYAGAGQCNINNGTLVGSLSLSYDSVTEELTVAYALDAPYTMSETHLYVGTNPYPVLPNGNPTVAPGQYGNIHNLNDVSSDSYVLQNINGSIYFIAHAVVCGF